MPETTIIGNLSAKMPNGNGYAYVYGLAVSSIAPSGETVSVVWTDDNSPEMTPGEHRFRALRHAWQLIEVDGSCYADQVTVTEFAGGLGTFTTTGRDAVTAWHETYDAEHQAPSYWEGIRYLLDH